MLSALKLTRLLFPTFCFILSACSFAVRAAPSADKGVCAQGNVVETGGYRRLALIVGVGQYKNDEVPDLPGPPNDARRIYELLTGNNGYGFPKENVCMLLDEQATTEHFRQAFEQHLVQQARKNDVVVVYYAGHGSQTPDQNHDEPDGQDETFLLHDARTGKDGNRISDLRDDEFNKMLGQLYEKTHNVMVMADACNSGTAIRGEAGTLVARFVEPDQEKPSEVTTDAAGDGSAEWIPESMPGMVAFTAASDGTSALEQNGRGIFTDAVLQIFSQVSGKPLTYAQAARQVPPPVAARSYQIPYFQGNLDRPVFGNTSRNQPVGWEITEVGPPVKLSGPPIPGLGKGAELRIYGLQTKGADTRDPSKAKATVVIDEMIGLNATARVSARKPDAPQLAAGDLAVLIRPADDYVRIKVRLKPSGEASGIPAERAAALRKAVAEDPETSALVDLSDGPGEFELSVNNDGQLQLRGPENLVRITYLRDEVVAENLWQHARQKGLLQLQGEGGSDFTDNQTLKVQLVPAAKQDQCARGKWEQAGLNSDQIIPLCHRWNVQVTLTKDSPSSLLMGGVVLSTDGSTFGFPADGRSVLLRPGETAKFNADKETFKGALPLDVWDHLLVFGTKAKNPVRWDLLTSVARTRGPEPAKGGLYQALDRYLLPGTRGQGVDTDTVEDTTWALSKINIRVEANSRFAKPAERRSAPVQTREFTIGNFDIRPYLPDDGTSALYKVLQKANWLSRASITDGIGYKQHAWNQATDELNLKLGIDCSRATWFAFTRAGLPYNNGDKPVVTADMVTSGSPMNDRFERCDDSKLQIGDLLVYRDDTRGDGHVVMVIDPLKRIAWGSHGFDGNAKELKVKPDTGVEYQLIKYKQDWERWDRKTMRQRVCWRYKQFAEEAKAARGLPGTKALTDICNAERQCGL